MPLYFFCGNQDKVHRWSWTKPTVNSGGLPVNISIHVCNITSGILQVIWKFLLLGVKARPFCPGPGTQLVRTMVWLSQVRRYQAFADTVVSRSFPVGHTALCGNGARPIIAAFLTAVGSVMAIRAGE